MTAIELILYTLSMLLIFCTFVSLGAAVAWAFIHVIGGVIHFVEWVARRVRK